MNSYAILLRQIKERTSFDIYYKDTVSDTRQMPYIEYAITPISDDGVKSMDKLEFRIYTKTFSESYKINNQIRSILLHQGDLIGGLFYNVELSGGGSLLGLDGKSNIHISYYKILKKSEAI